MMISWLEECDLCGDLFGLLDIELVWPAQFLCKKCRKQNERLNE